MASTRTPAIDGPRSLASDDEIDREISKLISIQENLESRMKTSRGTKLTELKQHHKIVSNRINSFTDPSKATSKLVSKNPYHYWKACEIGSHRLTVPRFRSTYGTKQLIVNELFKESSINLGCSYNKVFCSQWLNDHQIVMGTKCNNILIRDLSTNKTDKIETLASSRRYHCENDTACGIHAIEINPSRTHLVTGADQPHEVALYSLPSFDPLCVGENAHTDWIFDLKWLDDEFFVSGSRDCKISLWRVPEDGQKIVQPLTCFTSKNQPKRIRALVYNDHLTEVVSLCLGQSSCPGVELRMYDPITTAEKYKGIPMPEFTEYVCLSQNKERSLYAVGCRNQATLIDSRSHKQVDRIPSSCHHTNTRSISFADDICTIGTGNGAILFYDVRARKFMERRAKNEDGRSNPAFVACTDKGHVNYDASYYEAFLSNIEYTPAIYTHCFDASFLRLFAAGGPLPASVSGNFAAIWS